jgi:hypothetical protein
MKEGKFWHSFYMVIRSSKSLKHDVSTIQIILSCRSRERAYFDLLKVIYRDTLMGSP